MDLKDWYIAVRACEIARHEEVCKIFEEGCGVSCDSEFLDCGKLRQFKNRSREEYDRNQ